MEKEIIKAARGVILGEYLRYKGEPIKRSGRRYRHTEHESLVFTDNSFYWNSRSEKGNSIDFLMLYYGMDFKTAVRELAEYSGIAQTYCTAPRTEEEFRFSTLALDIRTAQTAYYLTDIRGIDRKLVNHFISNCYIYQEIGTNNIIFPMYDEHHKAVGAELHGSTTDGRYKGIYKNSKYGYGFNIIYGTPKYLCFFESAIDLLSYIELMVNSGRTLRNIGFVSMGGLKENVVKHMTEVYHAQTVICADNDSAGRTFTEKLMQKFPVTDVLYPPLGKDWNEYLMLKKKS